MRKRLLSMSFLVVKKTKTHEKHSRNSPLSQRIYCPKGADDPSKYGFSVIFRAKLTLK